MLESSYWNCVSVTHIRALITLYGIATSFGMPETKLPGSTLITFTSLELNLSTINFSTTLMQRPRYSDSPETIQASWRIFLGTLLTAGIVCGVFGNMLVFFAIVLEKTLNKNNGNLMILSLAVTDLLMVSLPVPIFGVDFVFYWPQWRFGESLCRVTHYVLNLCGSMSLFTMLLIAMDRYFAVVRNTLMLKRRNVKIVLCSLWLMSAVYSIYPVLTSDVISRHTSKHGDWELCFNMDSKVLLMGSTKFYTYVRLLSIGIFILIVGLSIYARIGVFLWRARNSPIHQNMQSTSADKISQALKLMFAILLTNAICWLPYMVAMFSRIAPIPPENRYIDSRFWLMASSMAMLNSSINPVLYALVSQKFRAAYQSIFRRAKARLLACEQGKGKETVKEEKGEGKDERTSHI